MDTKWETREKEGVAYFPKLKDTKHNLAAFKKVCKIITYRVEHNEGCKEMKDKEINELVDILKGYNPNHEKGKHYNFTDDELYNTFISNSNNAKICEANEITSWEKILEITRI